MKRIFALILIIILVFSTVTALGETIDYSNIKVYVNGMRIALFDSKDNLQQAVVIIYCLFMMRSVASTILLEMKNCFAPYIDLSLHMKK